MGVTMKVARWGNSLAVRLPAELVRELGLKEGDLVDRDKLALRKLDRQQALEMMRSANWELPADYKFDRDEANAR